MNKSVKTIFIVIGSFVVGAVLTCTVFKFSPLMDSMLKTTVVKENGKVIVEDGSLADAVEKVYDAVVLIQGFQNNQLASTGTGFIYKTDNNKAYIMTNHHVISDMSDIKIVLSDDTEISGKVLGSDEYLDLAVISVDKKYIKAVATIGDSTKMRLGDTVFTIGSPLGYSYRGSVTAGRLSGKDRMVSVSVGNSNNNDWVMRVLQTDAAINPGNSGGPLLNSNAEVIGINSMKLVQEEIEGMGFAIPIEYAMSHIDSLEKGEKIEWPVLGINMINVEDNDKYRNPYRVDDSIKTGVIVVKVVEKTGAASSDLKEGDVIVAINGEQVASSAYLRYELYKYKVGEEIEITYNRDGKEHKTKVKLSKGE